MIMGVGMIVIMLVSMDMIVGMGHTIVGVLVGMGVLMLVGMRMIVMMVMMMHKKHPPISIFLLL